MTTKIVKMILLRRSATRNMFRRRESTGVGPPLPVRDGETRCYRVIRPRFLAVGEGVALGGRAPVAPRGRHDLDGTTGRFDRLLGAGRERVHPHREGSGELA